jgi:hypothetical protein
VAPAAAVPAYPDRWLLMKSLQGTWPGAALDGCRTQIYGWTEVTFVASSVGHNDLPESFDYRGNEINMQQTWLRIVRPTVPGQTTNGTSYLWPTATTEPTFGYEVDILYGTDYRFTLPQRGTLVEQLTGRHGLPNTYGIDPVQFYGDAYFPTIGRGLDIHVGRMYCLYGVESLEATANPLVSHAYIFSNGSPFTHTGAMATLVLTPEWQVQAMAIVGSDLFIDPADEPTFSGSIQWTQPQGTQSVSRNIVKASTVFGPGKYDAERLVNHINVFDFVWTHNFNPVLSSNVEALYGYQRHVPGTSFSLTSGTTPVLDFVNWGGVAGYLNYTFSPRVVGTVRLEAFDDPQGVRTSSAEDPFLDRTKGLYTALTAGLTCKLWTPVGSQRGSVIFQPEIRYDYNLDSEPFGSSVAHPFDGHHGLLSAAAAMIVRW